MQENSQDVNNNNLQFCLHNFFSNKGRHFFVHPFISWYETVVLSNDSKINGIFPRVKKLQENWNFLFAKFFALDESKTSEACTRFLLKMCDAIELFHGLLVCCWCLDSFFLTHFFFRFFFLSLFYETES